MSKIPVWLLSMSVAAVCASAVGAEGDKQNDLSDYFQRGNYEVSLISGAMFSPIGADHNRPTVDYTLSGLQFGWMLSDAGNPSWLRGNWEVSIEAMGGSVFKGRGSYLAGGTAWARYNFLQSNWRIVPYVQGGAGAEATDMDQRLIGENFNFNLNVAAGLKWFLARNWALDFECRYQHISNAKLSKHDVGINAVGPMLGVSFFF